MDSRVLVGEVNRKPQPREGRCVCVCVCVRVCSAVWVRQIVDPDSSTSADTSSSAHGSWLRPIG